VLRIGRGVDRKAIRQALADPAAVETVVYEDILAERDIRETVAGIRDAGTPPQALPLLAWLASHPNTPEDILRELGRDGTREVLLSLAVNENLPQDMRRALLDHANEDVREHANHTFSQRRRH
jgi:hypothetical protein